MYNLVLKIALHCFSFKFSFYNKVSHKTMYRTRKVLYERIYTSKCFFQISCCRFLFFGQNWSLLKNQRFLPKILVCEEMYFIETSGKTWNLYLSVIRVSFEIRNPLLMRYGQWSTFLMLMVVRFGFKISSRDK